MVGVAIFLIGIVLGSISVLELFAFIPQPRNAFLIDTIGPMESKTMSVHVYNPTKPVNILMSNYDNANLRVVMQDSHGKVILDTVYDVSKNSYYPITDFGYYRLTITNLSDFPAKINSGFRQTVSSPEPMYAGYEEVIALFLCGTVLFFAGIILMFFGAKVSRSERNQEAV